MSQVIIEEQGGRRRTLTLRGAALPFQGAEWTGEQIEDTSWNPGSSVATQQVLGPKEPPSEWEGEWNTTRLVSLPALFADGASEKSVSRADELADAADGIRVSGQLLRVTWVMRPGRRRVMYGRLTKLALKYTRADDVHWNATFTWIGLAPNATATVPSDSETLAATRAAALAASQAAANIEAAAIIQSNPKVKNSASTFTLGDLEALADAPKQIVASFANAAKAVDSRLRQLSDIAAKIRGEPSEVMGQIVDAARDAVAVANGFVDAMTRQTPESMSTRAKVANLLRAVDYFGAAQVQAELIADAAARTRAAAAARRAAGQRAGADPRGLAGGGDLLAVVVPRLGDTMLSISKRFYDGDDLSDLLSRANGFPSATIVPPRGPIVVPTRAALERNRGR